MVRPSYRRAAAIAGLIGIASAIGFASASAPATRRKGPGAVAGPVRLVARGPGTLRVAGLNSYFGTIQLSSAGDGLVVVNRLPLERYLLGLNEVPPDWPEEALKAQAVAARTYALNTLSRPRAGSAAVYGFDICATVQCQVFSGADVVQTADGGRWADAVAATAGQTILYDGEPILARYHSTSGGATLDNPQAFPGEPSYPYLLSVPSTTEEASPLYRWRVEFTRRDLQQILERAGWWGPGDGRLVEARTVLSRTGLHYPDILFRGKRAGLRDTAENFREIVRGLAPAMFPDEYPSAAPTASGQLPETLPSNRIVVRTHGRRIEVIGRGWGHGVGMSQWGAHGLAVRGASYAGILTHYYTGVTIGEAPAVGPVDVGVAWGRGAVAVTGSFRMVDARGKTVEERALGTWRFRPAGPGAVAIEPPEGYGLPLRLGVVDAPAVVAPGAEARITIALSRPARVKVAPASGSKGVPVVRNAGRQHVAWSAPEEPGRYEVTIRASTGPSRSRTQTVALVVAPPPEDADVGARAPADVEEDSFPDAVALVVAGFLLVLAVAVLALKGRISQ